MSQVLRYAREEMMTLVKTLSDKMSPDPAAEPLVVVIAVTVQNSTPDEEGECPEGDEDDVGISIASYGSDSLTNGLLVQKLLLDLLAQISAEGLAKLGFKTRDELVEEFDCEEVRENPTRLN